MLDVISVRLTNALDSFVGLHTSSSLGDFLNIAHIVLGKITVTKLFNPTKISIDLYYMDDHDKNLP